MNYGLIQPNQLIDISNVFLGKRVKKILRGMNDIETQLTSFLSMIMQCKRVYEGLPKELKYREYLIEFLLYWYGSFVLLKKNDMYFALPCAFSSTLNFYGEATRTWAYGLNGQSFGEVYIRNVYDDNLNLVHEQNAVLFKNNSQMIPQYSINKPIIQRLVYIWQTMGIQNGLSRIKLLIYSNSDIAPKIKDLMDNIISNEEVSCVVPTEMGSSLMDDVKESNFGGTYDPTSTWYDFDKCFSLLLSLNGITSNADNSKKERQTRTEIIGGDTFTAYSDYNSRRMRDIAIEECKEIFGLNISLKDLVDEELREKNIEYAQAFTGGGGVGVENKNSTSNQKSQTGYSKKD